MGNATKTAVMGLVIISGLGVSKAYAKSEKQLIRGSVFQVEEFSEKEGRPVRGIKVKLERCDGKMDPIETEPTDENGDFRFTSKIPVDFESANNCYKWTATDPNQKFRERNKEEYFEYKKEPNLKIGIQRRTLDAPQILNVTQNGKVMSLQPKFEFKASKDLLDPTKFDRAELTIDAVEKDSGFLPYKRTFPELSSLKANLETGEFNHKFGEGGDEKSGKAKLLDGTKYVLTLKIFQRDGEESKQFKLNFQVPSAQGNPILPERGLPRLEGDYTDQNPSWLVLEGRQEMVYSSDRGTLGSFQIWRSKIGASGTTQVTTALQESNDTFPMALPGREAIMFVSNRSSGVENLWSVSLKGAQLMTQITQFSSTSKGTLEYPTISKDGALIAFARKPMGTRREEAPSIWTMTASGGNLTQLCSGTMPKISPDGKQMLYVNQSGAHASIWRIGVDGANNTQITAGTSSDNYPDWIDNDRIIFTSDRTGNQDLWMMDLRDGSQIPLTNNIANDFSPAVSPDGKLVAFVSDRGSKKDKDIWNIYWMSLEPILQMDLRSKSGQ